MKNAENADKNAQIGAIMYAYNVLKAKKVIRNQKQFAALLGVTEQTISNAINGKGRSLNATLVNRIADYMVQNYGVDIFTPAASIFVTGDVIQSPAGDSSIKTTDDNVSRLLDMLDERDAQINRLLTLLENEQAKNK